MESEVVYVTRGCGVDDRGGEVAASGKAIFGGQQAKDVSKRKDELQTPA